MSRAPKKPSLPKYVLCQGPFTQPDSVYFLVDVFPGQIVNDRQVRFVIAGSAFPESFPRHQLTWAVGCRLIDLLHDPKFIASKPRSEDPIVVEGLSTGLAKATGEIEYYISQTDKTTRAFQAVRCQSTGCSEPILLPNGQLQLGQEPRYGLTQRPLADAHKLASVPCPSCHSVVFWRAGELLVLVEPLGELP